MRVVFMGTPPLAVPSLERLVARGFDVRAVVTQPDRPAGRSPVPRPSAVKIAAQAHGISVLQPETLRDPTAVEALRAHAPDAIVVVAFGQILRRAVLALPRLGCVNLHPSLLPAYRGAAPIPAAIRAGWPTTGVTIMLMDPGMDTGPILSQVEVPIGPRDTTGSLGDRLAEVGADLLVETLPRLEAGTITPRPQDDSRATYTRPLRKEDGAIDWRGAALEIDRQCRANDPWPGCFTSWNDRHIRIRRARPDPAWSGDLAPGTVFARAAGVKGRELAVATGAGALILDEVQLEGRKALNGDEFARGQPGFVGAVLGTKAAPSP